MVRKSAQAHAVRTMAVVQAGVAGLDAVQAAVEGGRLDANLRDQVACKVSLEVGRVRGARIGEEVSVEERGDGCLPAHDGSETRESSEAVWGRKGTPTQSG